MTPNPEIPTGPWLRPIAPIKRAYAIAGRAVAVAAVALVAGCGVVGDAIDRSLPAGGERAAEEPSTFSLNPIEFTGLPGWQTDILVDGVRAFTTSCPAIAKQPASRNLGYRPEHGTMGDLQKICVEAAKLDTQSSIQLRVFMERNFRPFEVSADTKTIGKFTGYYEPLLRGSWQRDNRYVYPIYSRPRDIIVVDLEQFDPDKRGVQLAGRLVDNKILPYHDRREIEAGALAGRRLELIWTDDPVQLFFLHVQGSGRVLLPDGSFVRLAFSGRNGHRYTSIGRELVAQGVMRLEDVSLFSLRAWMRQNPLAASQVMQKNRSFIFFRVEKDQAVKGAQGVPLTPGRSMAVDPKYIPLGLPIWLVTTDPLDPKSTKPLRRLVVAQDTGSAIKGPIRGDLFWGFGEEAEDRAGLMNERGSYYLLFPRKPL